LVAVTHTTTADARGPDPYGGVEVTTVIDVTTIVREGVGVIKVTIIVRGGVGSGSGDNVAARYDKS
jgi:hypothetical protein